MYQPYEKFIPKGQFISVIGSGGKTTLLRVLSQKLQGSVILTTSTHIFPFSGMPLIDTGTDNSAEQQHQILHHVRAALLSNRVICIGQQLPSGKLTSPSSVISFEMLSMEAEYVLVEAVGAAGHPRKAHRPWEPVVPSCSSMTICVVGASGIGKSISSACHCPELFSALAGISPDQAVCPEHIASVLNHEDLADCYLVNQIDTLSGPDQAMQLCSLIRKDAYMCSLKSDL